MYIIKPKKNEEHKPLTLHPCRFNHYQPDIATDTILDIDGLKLVC